jgi:hypothetical protein
MGAALPSGHEELVRPWPQPSSKKDCEYFEAFVPTPQIISILYSSHNAEGLVKPKSACTKKRLLILGIPEYVDFWVNMM